MFIKEEELRHRSNYWHSIWHLCLKGKLDLVRRVCNGAHSLQFYLNILFYFSSGMKLQLQIIAGLQAKVAAES